MKKKKKLYLQKKKRYLSNIFGTQNRPRLAIFKSNNHIYGQIINDETGKTLVSYSSLNPQIKKNVKSTANVETAFKVGEHLGILALQQKITKIVFDKGTNSYIGRIKHFTFGLRSKDIHF